MGTVKLAGVATFLLCAQAYAQSTVNFTVELSPYNQVYVQNYKSGARTYFTMDGTFSGPSLGNSANGQQFPIGSIITWDLKAAVDPNLLHQGTVANGTHPAGLANLVFNLRLENSSGQPITNVGAGSPTAGGWYSAINDGTGGDPVAAAAFALSFNVGGANGPGRLIDMVDDLVAGTPNGGPNLGLFTYPTLSTGQLLGEGCGYTAWNRTGGSRSVTMPGVGLDTIIRPAGKTPPTIPGLGIKAVCEGQLNTTGLAAGTYKLHVLPGAGVNVLRGDLDAYAANADSFAVAANAVNGDDISFQLVTGGTLVVNITPPEAVTAGAQFAIDGGFWQNPGTISVVPGTHAITFKPVAGYNTPTSRNVSVTAGGNGSTTGAYSVATGTLTVVIDPAGIGGQFAVNGGPWQDPGQITLPVGNYAISFKPVDGYDTPPDQNVTIAAGQNTPVTGTYMGWGTLTVSISPFGIGGAFSIDNGESWIDPMTLDLPTGTYHVTFRPVDGYTTPESQDAVVTANHDTLITGTYLGWGTLTVSISPAGIGGAFSIDNGESWIDPTTLDLPTGTYPVFFLPVNGYVTPPSQDAVVTKDHDTLITATYVAVQPPNPQTAVSRRTHSGPKFPPPGTFTQAFDLPLNIASGSAVSVECRDNTKPAAIVVTYDKAIGGTISITNVTNAVLGSPAFSVNGTNLTVNLASMTNKSCVSFTINGVADAASPTQIAPAKTIKFKMIKGDVTGTGGLQDGKCDAQDVTLLRSRTAGPNVNSTNYWLDLDMNGSIGATDVTIASTNTFVNVPPLNCAN